MVQKRIKISCKSKIIPNQDNHAVWRNWKVQIQPIKGELPLSRFIQRVEYILHPSFKTSHIVCTQEPYQIKQEGWGSFDLKIVFHFKDKSQPPQTVFFDLNFDKPSYSVCKTLRFKMNKKDRFCMERREAKRNTKTERYRENSVFTAASSYTASSASSSSTSVSTPDSTAYCTNYLDAQYDAALLSNVSSPYYLTPQQQEQQEQHSSYLAADEEEEQQQNINDTVSGISSSASSTSQQRKNNSLLYNNRPSKNRREIPKHINIVELGSYLESLDDVDLRQVYKIMLEFCSKDRPCIDAGDHYVFDLYSLNPNLLQRLWDFIESVRFFADY